MSNHASYAARYIEKFGFRLIPIEPGRKFPLTDDWGNNTLDTPEDARAFYDRHPDWSMGVVLGPSRMCSLDIDCEESFRLVLEEFGIDIETLADYPTIQGSAKGRRIMFRMPEGENLKYAKLNWKRQEDAKKQYTVFELRSACDGKQRQDVLPPSTHVTTQRPYKWLVPPAPSFEEWPEPPAWLMSIWEAWDQFKPQLQQACPWAPEPEPVRKKSQSALKTSGKGGSVIESYLAANTLEDALRANGYRKIGKRWLSPHSGTGLPGVTILPGGQSCYIHHASDPLCSEESGRPVNAFDLYCEYNHAGDTSKAVKALSEEYGTPYQRTVVNLPAHAPDTHEDHAMPPVILDEYPDDDGMPPVFDDFDALHDGDDMPPPVAVDEPRVSQSTEVNVSTASGVSATGFPMLSGGGDYNSPLIFTTDKGKPKKHIANLREICRRLRVVVRYNEISKEEEIITPGHGWSIDNQANASLAWLKSECSLYDFPGEAVQEYVTVLADENQYNPVRTWVGSKPWDGVDRLSELCDTIKQPNPTERAEWLKRQLLMRWSISAIAAAYSPNGVSAGGVLVFQGAQYVGKTKWFKTLVPRDLDLLKDGMLLRPDDKDSVQQATSFWLVELGELDSTFRRADIAALKAFITNDQDVYRKAYAKRESKVARRTVFFGSVNPKEFLHDSTGNRRYWTIECEELDHSHGIDMQQYWAQILHLYNEGEGHFLKPEEMDALNESNEGFMAAEPVEEKIMASYDWDSPSHTWRWLSSTQVLNEVGFDRPTKADCTTAAMVVRKMNGGTGKKSGGQRLLAVPAKDIRVDRYTD